MATPINLRILTKAWTCLCKWAWIVGIAWQKSPHNEEALSLGLLQQALEQDFFSEEGQTDPCIRGQKETFTL
jgi:hypothetical protein